MTDSAMGYGKQGQGQFDVFVRRKVYRRYAELFLDKEQIDEVDESKIPGYVP